MKADPVAALVTPLVTTAKDKDQQYPGLVEFADASEQTVPIDVLLPAESYRMKRLRLHNKMKMTFAADGAQLTFDAGAKEATATFTPGQTLFNPACSLGCHNNFFIYKGRQSTSVADAYRALQDANEEGLTDSKDFVAAEEVPCGSDTVILPRGFGYSVLAFGIHAYKDIVFAGPGSSSVTAKSEADLPPYFTWPNMREKLFLGKDVADVCADHGYADAEGKCMCTSECPANMNTAVHQTSKLRNATKLHAQYRLNDLGQTSKSTAKYAFEFGNAFKLRRTKHQRTKASYQGCKVDGAAAGKLVGTYFGGVLASSDITAKIMPGNRVKVTGSIQDYATEVVDALALNFDGAIRVLDQAGALRVRTCGADEIKGMQAEATSDKCAAMFVKYGGAVNEDSDEACECLLDMPLQQDNGLFENIEGWCKTHGSTHTVADVLAQCQAKAGGATALVDVKNMPEAALAMHVYHAVVESMACLDDAQTVGLVAAAGLKEEKEATVHIYGGANLPQMDVHRLVDGNNVEGVVDHVYSGLSIKSGFKLGFTKVSKQDMRQNWKLLSPHDRVHGENAATMQELHTDAQYGFATQLIDVQITYSGWTTGAGPNVQLLERVVNYLLATYELQSHHKCFEFATGYNQQCIDQIVHDTIVEDLGNDECRLGKHEDCLERAIKVAVEAIRDIRGCGLLGSQVQVGHETRQKCADGVEEQRVLTLAASLANSTISLQASLREASNETEGTVTIVAQTTMPGLQANDVDAAALLDALAAAEEAHSRAGCKDKPPADPECLALNTELYTIKTAYKAVQAKVGESEDGGGDSGSGADTALGVVVAIALAILATYTIIYAHVRRRKQRAVDLAALAGTLSSTLPEPDSLVDDTQMGDPNGHLLDNSGGGGGDDGTPFDEFAAIGQHITAGEEAGEALYAEMEQRTLPLAVGTDAAMCLEPSAEQAELCTGTRGSDPQAEPLPAVPDAPADAMYAEWSAPTVDGTNAVAVEDDGLAPYDVVQPDSATANAAAAPYSLELRGHAVYVEACAYTSAKGKPCAHIAAAGAGSSYCQNHTCQHAGCAESKSSQQRFCTRHIATSSFAADAGVHDVALDAEGSGASTHTAEAPRPSGYFLASATGGADTDVGRPGASSTVGSKPRTPGRGKGAAGTIQTGRRGDAAVSRLSQAVELAGQSGALPYSVVPQGTQQMYADAEPVGDESSGDEDYDDASAYDPSLLVQSLDIAIEGASAAPGIGKRLAGNGRAAAVCTKKVKGTDCGKPTTSGRFCTHHTCPHASCSKPKPKKAAFCKKHGKALGARPVL